MEVAKDTGKTIKCFNCGDVGHQAGHVLGSSGWERVGSSSGAIVGVGISGRGQVVFPASLRCLGPGQGLVEHSFYQKWLDLSPHTRK